MNWASFAELAEMGGYGLYVWGAYVMVAAAVVWEGLLLVQRRLRALEELRARALRRAAGR